VANRKITLSTIARFRLVCSDSRVGPGGTIARGIHSQVVEVALTYEFGPREEFDSQVNCALGALILMSRKTFGGRW
jgi:hypothetical protein